MEITVFVSFKGRAEGTMRLTIERRMVAGRNSADISLNDPSCSRKHFSMERMANGKLLVKDLLSANGTFVNGRRISVAAIGPGDQIRVGDTVLSFEGRKTKKVEVSPTDNTIVHGSAALFQCLPKEVQDTFESAGYQVPTVS